jgi:hypothetical protein
MRPRHGAGGRPPPGPRRTGRPGSAAAPGRRPGARRRAASSACPPTSMTACGSMPARSARRSPPWRRRSSTGTCPGSGSNAKGDTPHASRPGRYARQIKTFPPKRREPCNDPPAFRRGEGSCGRDVQTDQHPGHTIFFLGSSESGATARGPSRSFDDPRWGPIEAPNRRPRRTIDVETRREASRGLLPLRGGGRPPLSRPELDSGPRGWDRSRTLSRGSPPSRAGEA